MGIYTADAGTVLIDGKKEIIRGPRKCDGAWNFHDPPGTNPVLDMQGL